VVVLVVMSPNFVLTALEAEPAELAAEVAEDAAAV